MGINRPWVERCANDHLLNVNEPLLLQHLSGIVVVRNRLIPSGGRICQVIIPLVQHRIGCKSAVIATRLHVNLDLLDPPVSWLEVAK